MSKIKPSEIFEGENSSLRKTYDEAVGSDIKTTAREMFDEFYGKSWKELCEEYGNPPKVELRNYLKPFIDQAIDLAIAEERKRVVEMIEKERDETAEREGGKYYNYYFDCIIDLITNNK